MLLFFCFYLCGFRYKTGADWSNYMQLFDECLLSKKSNVESGFMLLNKVVKSLYGNFWTLQILISIFCCAAIYSSISKNVLIPAVSFLFYFMNHFFNGEMAQTRQLIAMSILILGTRNLQKLSIWKWFIFVIIACQFHITALFAFPLYFTNKKVIKTRTAFILLFGYFFINFFSLNFINGVFKLLSLPIFSFLPQRLLQLVYVYTHLTEYGKQADYSSGIGFLVTAVIIIFLIILYHNSDYETKKKSCFLNFFLILFFNGLGRNFDQFVRFGYYYSICGFGISAYGLFFKKNSFYKKFEWIQPVANFLIISFFILSFFKVYYLPNNGKILIKSYLPWKNFFLEAF
ncbi:MAG: EpsG family protein [Spirochaetia bacterium]|nr:EpsG family protein [Spirochaetia bacterium]